MAGHGIPRSIRHLDGFGIHTYRLLTNDGKSKLVKWHWKTLQGKASFVWEEAQQTSGKNPDHLRQDLWEAIEAERYPEWEVRIPWHESTCIADSRSLVSKSWKKKMNCDSASTCWTLPRLFPKNMFLSLR